MKGGSDVVSSVQNIKQAHEHFSSFQREYPDSKGAKIFENYKKKLEWVVKDLITMPMLTDDVRKGIREEWESDVFAVPAIQEKIALLPPDKRDVVESIIDKVIIGESVTIIFSNKTETI